MTARTLNSLFAYSAVAALLCCGPAVQAQGLVHRYSFTTDAGDSVGGANGTLVNGAAVSGGAVQLDGVNDYVALPTGLVSSLTNSTFEAWVNWTNNGNYSRIFDFGDSTTNYMFLTPQIDAGRGGNEYFAITTTAIGAEQTLSSGTALPTGALAQTAVTIDAANHTSKLYINGSLVATNTAMTLTPSSLGNTSNNWLGRSEYGGDPYFQGSMSEFRIYNTTLTEAQVLTSFTLGPDVVAADVPEPTSLALLAGLGVSGSVLIRRRRMQRRR